MSTPKLIPSIDKLPSILIFSGDDSLGREKIKEQLFELLFEAYGSLTEEYYDNTRESFDEYLIRMITPTIFADTRLFHIKHVQKLSEQELTLLSNTMGKLLAGTYLLIEYETDKKKQVPQKLKIKKRVTAGMCLHFDFAKPKAYQLPDWLAAQVKSLFGRKIDKSAVELLIDYTGTDLERIYTELQKLDIYLPHNGVITTEVIEKVSGTNRACSPSELCNGLGRREWKTINSVIDSIDRGATYATIGLLSSVYRHFWSLYKIHVYGVENPAMLKRYYATQYKEKNATAADIAVAVGFFGDDARNRVYPAVILPRIIEQAHNYTKPSLETVLCMTAEYDRDIKNGNSDDSVDMFRQYCYNVVRMGKQRG